jgi:hypothetical protein
MDAEAEDRAQNVGEYGASMAVRLHKYYFQYIVHVFG